MAKQSRIRTAVGKGLFSVAKNVMGGPGSDFDRSRLFNYFKSGNDLGYEFDEQVSKEALYRGYTYAAIRTRANAAVSLATEHLKNRNPENDEEIEEQHPYIKLIDESPSFTNTQFWYAGSTYYDMREFYILAVRAVTQPGETDVYGVNTGDTARVSEIQRLEILNPYNVQRVYSKDGTFGGYLETRGDTQREIPKEMMIVAKAMNPFSMSKSFPMVHAADDAQYLNEVASNYTRKSIIKNKGQRGAVAPDQVLGDEEYENFKSGIRAASTGEFMATNAPIKYTDMQIDLSKLALVDVNNVSIEKLIAVSGVSKTMLGIEQSGVTRDTSRVQKDLLIANHTIPTVQAIIDALNQDYRNYYQEDATKQEIYIDSPLKVDKEAEKKDAEIEKTKAEAAKTFIDAGYEPNAVTDYLELDEMVFEARQTTPKDATPDEPSDTEVAENKAFRRTINAFGPGIETVLRGFESSLATQVTSIQRSMFSSMLDNLADRFATNSLTAAKEREAMTEEDQEKYRAELAAALVVFYTPIVPLFAGQTAAKRLTEFGLPADFKLSATVSKTITANANKAAKSHVATFLNDVYETARKASLEGASRAQIVSTLTSKFEDLSRTDATRIARTESYKAVNMSQYEADRQFIKQNGLEGRAVKVWTVQSNNPCPFCVKMDGREVPFDKNFLDLGDTLTAQFDTDKGATSRELPINYQSIKSGTLHPNCSCTYTLKIK